VRIRDGCATVTGYKLPLATAALQTTRAAAGRRERGQARSQDTGLAALVRSRKRGANFSVKEKDEASPFRACGRGFAECLHSPICRGLKAFLLKGEARRRGASGLKLVTPRFKPRISRVASGLRAGLSTVNPCSEKPRRQKVKDQRMTKLRLLAPALAGLSLLLPTRSAAATITENFSANPLQNGWQIFGNTNLFQWDSTNQNLRVTWDSSQPNSYFYYPLGTILAKNDDFSLAFDLELDDVQVAGFGFELAIGLLNLSDATSTNFARGTGSSSPNLVELDYFPDVGYGPTVWPLFVDTNSLFNFNSETDYAIYAPILDDWYHVVMTYTASNQTMVTTMTNFEQTSGVTILDPLSSVFTDFRVNAFSINSYNDADAGGSIFAHGVVDNFVVTVPPPPVQNLTGTFSSNVWQVQFLSRSNWLYTLERTTTLQSWSDISGPTSGNGTNLVLQDTAAPTSQAFYRVRANRP